MNDFALDPNFPSSPTKISVMNTKPYFGKQISMRIMFLNWPIIWEPIHWEDSTTLLKMNVRGYIPMKSKDKGQLV